MIDRLRPRQIQKTQAGAATNTMAFSFTFSGDLPGCSVFEMRHLTVACEEAAGVVSPNNFNPFVVIITQGAKKFVFGSDRYNGGPWGLDFPDGLDLFQGDGDTVNITVNSGAAGNATLRHLFIRGRDRGSAI